MEQPSKVMVVDDEPDTVTFLRTWLEDMGYETCAESDPERVVEAALAQKPALLLLDVNMPSQSGIEVYRRLRETPPLGGLPVIFITGATDFHLFGRACSPLPEPAARIEKPIDLALLKRAIVAALDGNGSG
jgi:CheY-like chemotaxis protein